MDQKEARKRAKVKTANGVPCVAGAVPMGAWGGHEKAWGIYLVTNYSPLRLELLEA